MNVATQNHLPQSLLAEASNWLLRLQGDKVPQVEIAAWLEWCNADPLNLEAFDRAQRLYDQLRATSTQARADFMRLVEDAPAPRARRSGWVAITALAASLTALLVWSPWNSGAALDQHEYRTAHGAHRDVVLADDSKIVLGSASIVASRYTAETRVLELKDGEAFFDVEPERTRPFVVRAGEVTVTAIGTAFNVRRTRHRIVVAVTEGAVDVLSGSTPVRLRAGQQGAYAPGQRGLMVSAVAPATATAWQDGRFEYTTEPLASVIEDVNRYSRHPIVIIDPQLRDLVFTGTVFRDQAEEWVRALDTVFPLRVVERTDGSLALEARATLRQPMND